MKNNFVLNLEDRGIFHQCTDRDKLINLSNKTSIKAYIGFDCTAPSLHVGSLLQIMCLRHLQKNGHQPIVLLGGGTTLIGDPSGKDATRKILDEKEIKININRIKTVFKKLLDFKDKKTKPIFVDNSEWLSKLKYIEFLRNVGKHFTINKMLSFESVKLRLEREHSLSYMEFNYMILQAYDFYKLNNDYNCLLQMGGSDQWGNIVNGVELIRKINQKESIGLTTPLITLSSGAKMGKTVKGAIWLDDNLVSPYEYWQFWRNCSDEDVVRFLKFFTEIDIEKINEMAKKEKDINKLKIILANETTKILHGEIAAKDSENTAIETFKKGGAGTSLPEFKISKNEIEKGVDILSLLATNNIISSKSEARRAIRGNGIKVNDKLISDENFIVNLKEFKNNKSIKISHGKKKHFLIKII